MDPADLVKALDPTTLKSAIDVIVSMMKVMERTRASGATKSATVVSALQLLVNDVEAIVKFSSDVIAALKTMLDSGLVQPTIDVVCDAVRGRLTLAEAESCFNACWTWWRPLPRS